MANRGEAFHIHYSVKDQDGCVLADTFGKQTVEVLSGHSQVLPPVEKVLANLQEGERASLHIPCKDAYGSYREDRVKKKKISRLKFDGELKEGEEIRLWRWWGETTPVRVIEIDEQAGVVTLDFNHKYVGKDLYYELEMVKREQLPPVIG